MLQIISQKDEHCWVGELNGLRGEDFLRCTSPSSALASEGAGLSFPLVLACLASFKGLGGLGSPLLSNLG